MAAQPTVELLWPEGAPGAKGNKPEDKPTLTIYLPEKEKAVGTGIVICPGGGYEFLSTDREGRQFAEWFNSFGIAGFMLEYRHRGRGYGHPAPLQDAQRAIRMVRANAKQWNVDPKRIGIIGFSAGGHLASTVATHFDAGNPAANDPVERVSCRPDFLILAYPVIALGEPFTHYGSQKNLLGENPDPELIKNLSNEKQVTPETPPTFIVQTNEDDAVPAENAVSFYLALRRARVPAELHIYVKGCHGLAMAQNAPGMRSWPDRLKDWLEIQGFLPKK